LRLRRIVTFLEAVHRVEVLRALLTVNYQAVWSVVIGSHRRAVSSARPFFAAAASSASITSSFSCVVAGGGMGGMLDRR
jgi:hypothetical protein